jgi:hypothetical protein
MNKVYRFAVMGAISLFLQLSPASAQSTRALSSELNSVTCWIVDTDAYWDDLGALALLMPKKNVVAIVATGGIASPQQGIGTLGRFLSIGSSKAVLLQGKGSAATVKAHPDWSWLPNSLIYASRLEPELQKAYPNIKKADVSELPLSSGIGEATRNCKDVGILMIGPWTSYEDYEAAINVKLSVVVVLGYLGTNCSMDPSSCERSRNKLGQKLRQVSNRFFGSFEFDSYAPNSSPMSIALRKLSSEFGSAPELGQWDMLAALLILRPDLFYYDLSQNEFLPSNEQQAKSAPNELLGTSQKERH